MSAKIKARLKKLFSQEKGAVVRDWGARWPVALIYPQLYPVAMGNLGFQAIYRLLNDTSSLHCERAFLPAPEDWEEYRRTGTPLLSLESQRPLKDFAALAFSISFEADYPYVLQILAGAGVPLLAAERGPGDPLVIAGGVATFLNPEPLSPFVDAFFLGEGEAGAVPFLSVFGRSRARRQDRHRPLRELAQTIPGPTCPPATGPATTRTAPWRPSSPSRAFLPRVTAPHLPELAPYPTHSHILAPQSEWGEMFLVETGRGCSRGCRFCAAGFVYRPPRERPLEELWTQIQAGLMAKRKVGLVGAAVSDHPEVKELCRKILAAGRRYRHQFAAGRLRRRGAFPAAGPRRRAQRRPGPGGRQRPPAASPEQGPQPGRPGPGRGGRQPGRDPATAPLLHGGPAHRDPGGRGRNSPTGAPSGTLRRQGQPRQAPPGPHHPEYFVLCAQALHPLPVDRRFWKWRS